MSRITIKDIAKLLKVNPSTVSRALKDHPDIGETTKAKIKQIAEELGYRPNYQAINFRQRKSKMLALILPEIIRFFIPDLIKAMEEITKRKGYSLIIFQSNDSFEKEKECAQLCQKFGVEGLLVCLTRESQNIDHFQSFIQDDIPLILVDKIIPAKMPTVSINDFKAAFTAVQHLAKKNYQKIAGAFASENLVITRERKAGFKAALEKYDLAFEENLCLHSNSVEETKAGLLRLLRQKEKPDAIFTMTDELLMASMQVIYEEGLRIPEDLAVISLSNGYLPYYFKPKITHIKHSGYQIGQAAANLLVDLIEHPAAVTQRQIELETYLVELDSC